MSVRAHSFFNGRTAVEILHNEFRYLVGVAADNGKHLALVDAFDNAVDYKALREPAEYGEQSCLDAEREREYRNKEVGKEKCGSDVYGSVFVAEARAGRITAKQHSRIGSSVSGPLIGKRNSKSDIEKESIIVVYAVFMPNDLPRITTPRIRRSMFKMNVMVDAERGIALAIMTAIPVTPPKEKLFGKRKK